MDAVVDAISLRILRGELRPGARLPSVRALAEVHDVNVSTIQRAIARLEEIGIVVAKPRSGVEVLDPARHAGTGLWPVVLRHASEQRERAIALLRDVLDTRRALSVEVGRALVHVPRERYASELDDAIERFARVVRQEGAPLSAIAESENEIIRTALIAVGRPAVLAIHNDIGAMLISSEPVLRVIYVDPERPLELWRAFAQILATGGAEDHLAFIGPLLASADERAVAAFAATLGVGAPEKTKTKTKTGPAKTGTAKRKKQTR